MKNIKSDDFPDHLNGWRLTEATPRRIHYDGPGEAEATLATGADSMGPGLSTNRPGSSRYHLAVTLVDGNEYTRTRSDYETAAARFLGHLQATTPTSDEHDSPNPLNDTPYLRPWEGRGYE